MGVAYAKQQNVVIFRDRTHHQFYNELFVVKCLKNLLCNKCRVRT